MQDPQAIRAPMPWGEAGGELRQVIGCRLLPVHNKVLNERAVSRMCMVGAVVTVICQCHWQWQTPSRHSGQQEADGALAE
jgi:hypothetical protein